MEQHKLYCEFFAFETMAKQLKATQSTGVGISPLLACLNTTRIIHVSLTTEIFLSGYTDVAGDRLPSSKLQSMHRWMQ